MQKYLVLFALLATTFSLAVLAEDMPESKSISGANRSLERIVDEELGVVCYFSSSGNGQALSCLQLRKK